MSQAILHDPEFETMPREELEQLQFERLQSTLNRVYRNVAFYRTAFDAHHVNLERLKGIHSLRELPFTTKEDLQTSYPYDMFAVPLRDIVRIHTTSGTTGKSIVVGYTQNDLRSWTQCVARLLVAAGVSQHDVACGRRFEGFERVNTHLVQLLKEAPAVAMAVRAKLASGAADHGVDLPVVREDELIEESMPQPWREQHFMGTHRKPRVGTVGDHVRHHLRDLLVGGRQEAMNCSSLLIEPGIDVLHCGISHERSERVRNLLEWQAILVALRGMVQPFVPVPCETGA